MGEKEKKRQSSPQRLTPLVKKLLIVLLSCPIVARFAQEQVLPKVAQMDETEQLDKDVLKGLFEQGVSATSMFFNSDQKLCPTLADQAF